MSNNLIGDENGNTKIEVVLKEDDVWLNSLTISNLFNVDRTVITKHINNIYKDEELDKSITCATFAHMGNNVREKL